MPKLPKAGRLLGLLGKRPKERRNDGRSWPRKNFNLHREAANSSSEISVSNMSPTAKVSLAFGSWQKIDAGRKLRHLGTTAKEGKKTYWYEEPRNGWSFRKKKN